MLKRTVIATDRIKTYTCFQYAGNEYGNPNGGLDWSATSTGPFGSIGFNKGDGSRYYLHPDSGTDAIRTLDGIGKSIHIYFF